MLHAFIDESGDDGMTSKSSSWLLLAGYAIPESEMNAMKCSLAAGVQHIWSGKTVPSHVHFCQASHTKRKALLQLVRGASSNLTIFAIAAHKPSLDPEEMSRLRCPSLYNYMAKFLVERLTWYAADCDKKVRMTFATRSQIPFGQLKTYLLCTLRGRSYPVHDIKYERLDSIGNIPANHNWLVQGADWIASGFASGLNQDQHGQVEIGYTEILWGKFWIRKGNLWSYGIKVIPDFDRNEEKLFRRIGTWMEDPTTLT